MSEPVIVYTKTARVLHWVIGLLIIALIGIGLYMSDLPPSDAKWQLYANHKSIGMIVLFLVGARIIWRGLHQPPAPLSTHAKWERILAKATHILLYVGMVVMPVSGYLMSTLGGHPVAIFGLGVPALAAPDKLWGSVMHDLHEVGGNILIAAILLHVAGAIKHQMIDRDGTLKRMLWTRKTSI
jgi:cytochrome b561